MNRRTAIRQGIILSAGIGLLSSCRHQPPASTLSLKNLSIDGDQEKTLADLAETILPGDGAPGAKGIAAHLFVLTMLDDCYTRDQQQKFLRGLKRWDETSRTVSGTSFTASAPAQRVALVASVEDGKMIDRDLNYFYAETKKLTIQAYTGSAYFLTKIHPYELVPGRFHGCVPVKS